MNNELKIDENKLNELIIVENIPIIKQKLQIISDEVDKEIEYALSLDVSEENKQEVKNARTRINKIKDFLENKRKMVKETILQPYQQFEEIYNKLVKNKLKDASETLSNKIDAIESEQKQQKENELREFANEHFVANNIQDIVTFENIGLNITLSASIKSLKEQIVDFCKKVADDLDTILLEEKHNEILLEYKKCFDYAQAKKIVLEREKAIEEINAKSQDIISNKEQQIELSSKIDELTQDEIIAPIEVTNVEDNEERFLVTFSVTGTKEQLKQLKEFMLNIGLDWKGKDDNNE